ncbi:hypothetical protein [Streptomyces sp. NEAU-NA10]|uniref:hypothetical protein n=1 Tax=Streptomyces sp. NEAU-NA10 TaxID=3416050 RepID=UPI003CC6D892
MFSPVVGKSWGVDGRRALGHLVPDDLVTYVNAAFAAPALIGALLLPTKPVITKKPLLDIPGIVVVSEGRPAVLDNLVQNRLGF